MNIRDWLRPRMIVLTLLWVLPAILYVIVGVVALYQTGWLGYVALSLAIVWCLSWSVARFWPSSASKRVAEGQRLRAEPHWTPQDIAAVKVIEDYRDQVPPVPIAELLQGQRYVQDVRSMAGRLATHYFGKADETLVGNVTLVELLAVIHLAAADLEQWVDSNVPGSKLVKIKTLGHAPVAAKSMEWVQNAAFLASAISNPAKLLSFPIWKLSGNVVTELRYELLQGVYQRFLQQIGFYLIELYSGRLRGGSVAYERYFRRASQAAYSGGGRADASSKAEAPISETPPQVHSVSLAVMGQVKAGKSSLLNHLLRAKVAQTSVLPETRDVTAHRLNVPDLDATIDLLDTPGYSEAGVSVSQLRAIESASKKAHVLILVLSAVAPDRAADAALLRQLFDYYAREKHLKPPPVLVVLTHIDQLSPRREWSPPYNWQQPQSPKEQSIAAAVAYVRESLGSAVRDVVCVYTGLASDSPPNAAGAIDTTVLDETLPAIMRLLPEGQAAAILCAYYQQLSEKRLRQVLDQVRGLGSQITSVFVERLVRKGE